MSVFAKLIKVKKADAHTVVIYIAGEYSLAKHELVKICSSMGACFGIQPMEYIYSGGQELGLAITLINYARFSKEKTALDEFSFEVAKSLMIAMGQGSCSVITPNNSFFLTRRKEDV